MTNLMEPPVINSPAKDLCYAEPNVIDFCLLQEGKDHLELLEIVEKASMTGLFHIINHDLDPELFRTLRSVTCTYMMTTSIEQKDRDSAVEGTGSFEGYKPRTPAEKESGIVPLIEEYNYDYHGTGVITRPKILQTNEGAARKIFDFYHHELTPRLLDVINEHCKLEPGKLRQLHTDSSEVAHLLMYHPHWSSDIAKKRAAYSGHTDIGSVTYLYANPIASLQVYTREGWQYVAYIPNSIVVNMGDAMEFITQGRMNATLHRVIKPTGEQMTDVRTALVYFVHPNHATMSLSLRYFKLLREQYTQKCRQNPGCPIDGAGLNRVISALSVNQEDRYFSAVNPEAWKAEKQGGKVKSPPTVSINFHDLTIASVRG